MSESDAQRRVMVALSGGVDSAVAALLLVARGYDVTAVTLRLRAVQPWGPPVPGREAIARARRVSDWLGIPFHVVDAEEAFKREVVAPFVAEYAAGRTPNPCVRCNRFVRFGLLLERALAMGAQALATGHYAQVRENQGRYRLLRGEDRDKDQSYFLYRLTQAQLAHVLFPLGKMKKEAVRAIARRNGPPLAEQAESQDICFLDDEDYRRFLAAYAPNTLQPGPIQDTAGRVLGQHSGLAAYTIGQRKGLGISAPEPLYVVSIRPEENVLIVGTAQELGRDTCRIEDLHMISGQEPTQPFRAQAQIRYRARPAAVTVHPLPGGPARVAFDTSQRDITPGQSLVLYEDQVV
ncbi:MAG: tRNA 2-thiouridine(34) synthase MnmA, partial [Anaerolineae bacterium]